MKRFLTGRKSPKARSRQADVRQHALRIAAIIFQTVAIGAPANHVETVAPQRILRLPTALRDIFKQDDSVTTDGADPGKLCYPIRNLLGQTRERSLTKRIGD